MIPYRSYQQQLDTDVHAQWAAGHQNVLAVAATGSGKTVFFSGIIHKQVTPGCVIAHRHELVGQISMALARNGIRHRVVGSSALVADCRAAHIDEFGNHYVNQQAHVVAASVDTLINLPENDPIFTTSQWWVLDEAHHLLKHNKWGTAVQRFTHPQVRGLGVTAETERADGYGLGRMNDGLFDAIVLAPDMRDIISMGYLTDYRVFVPPSSLDLSNVGISEATGDFNAKKLAKETKAARMTGNVVEHYQRHAAGKLGIVFSVDIEEAETQAKAFRDAGVPAEMVSSKTNPALRRDILRRFRRREILILVNVDLFGEGFDLPAIEVVIMARASASFNLYKQQFGRALRLLKGKDWAIIIDHVGNVMRHGLPDQKRVYDLGRPVPKAKREPDENLIPQRVCLGCTQPYDRVYSCCPHCGHMVEVAGRSAPQFVDGDLLELSPEWLKQMRGEADKVINQLMAPPHLPDYVRAGIEKKLQGRMRSQMALRDTLQLWAGWQQQEHRRPDSAIYRLFFLTYGLDMLSAQSLGAPEADALREKIQSRLASNGVFNKTVAESGIS